MAHEQCYKCPNGPWQKNISYLYCRPTLEKKAMDRNSSWMKVAVDKHFSCLGFQGLPRLAPLHASPPRHTQTSWIRHNVFFSHDNHSGHRLFARGHRAQFLVESVHLLMVGCSFVCGFHVIKALLHIGHSRHDNSLSNSFTASTSCLFCFWAPASMESWMHQKWTQSSVGCRTPSPRPSWAQIVNMAVVLELSLWFFFHCWKSQILFFFPTLIFPPQPPFSEFSFQGKVQFGVFQLAAVPFVPSWTLKCTEEWLSPHFWGSSLGFKYLFPKG